VASAISEIIALGQRLEAAQALAERADSFEQAIGESEKRLADLHAVEKQLKADNDLAKRETADLLATAQKQVAAILSRAVADAREKLFEADEKVSATLAAGHAVADKLSDEANERRATIATLEDDESRLAQSVTALKAELDALKARVLG
jgi:16S rRNA G527 N7-methylase RsmG